MGKKFKIEYDRPKCIGAGACVAVAPKQWVMNNDDFQADLIGGSKRDESWFELEIEEADFAANAEAADVCPVKIIHILDLQTGAKLKP